MAIEINYNKDFIIESKTFLTVKFFIKENKNGNEHMCKLTVYKKDIYDLYLEDNIEENIIEDWVESLIFYSNPCDIGFFTMLCIESYMENNKIVFHIPVVGGYSIILKYNNNDNSFNKIDILIHADY